MFGLDLFTLAVAFLFFAIVLTILYKIVWHTFHGDIGEVFVFAIIGSVAIGILVLILSYTTG